MLCHYRRVLPIATGQFINTLRVCTCQNTHNVRVRVAKRHEVFDLTWRRPFGQCELSKDRRDHQRQERGSQNDHINDSGYPFLPYAAPLLYCKTVSVSEIWPSMNTGD